MVHGFGPDVEHGVDAGDHVGHVTHVRAPCSLTHEGLIPTELYSYVSGIGVKETGKGLIGHHVLVRVGLPLQHHLCMDGIDDVDYLMQKRMCIILYLEL